MDASSTLVIKVKYGDTLRRFNAGIVGEKLSLTVDGLKEKIASLFSFSPESEQILTYIDEDQDVVTLADDEDLHDVVKQALNPLRLTVRLVTGKVTRQSSRSSGFSTPMQSATAQQNTDFTEILKKLEGPLGETVLKSITDLASKSFSSGPNNTGTIQPHDLNSGLSHVLRSVQEPLRETLVKLTTDVASNSAISAPAVADLVDNLTKVSLSHLDKLSDSTPKAQNDIPESRKKKLSLEKPQPVSNMEKTNDVEIRNSTLSPNSFTPKITNAGKAKSVMKTSESSSNDKSPAIISELPSSSVAKNIYTEKEINKPTNLNPEQKIANGSVPDPLRGDDILIRPYYDAPGSHFPWMPAPHPAFQYVGSGVIFHRGVRCDGCGASPITGPRFKSKVKVDYDLCEICFSGMGDYKDYIRMEFPAAYHTSKSFKGLLNKVHRVHQHGASTIPHVGRILKSKSCRSKLDSRFIQDVNVIDGTVMAPLTHFTKIWRVRNNGTVTWPAKTQLVWIGGDRLCTGISFEVKIPDTGIQADQELNISVDFKAPELPGRYISYWRMATPSGQKFGQRIWVLIQVDTSLKETHGDGVRGFNLNLLPVSNDETGPSIVLEDLEEPVVEDNLTQPDNNGKKKIEMESVELYPNVDHEKKFPINDSLLVGSGASTSVSPSAPSISYPIIDLPYGESVFPYVPPPVVDSPPPPPPPVVTPDAYEDIEKNLLNELEIMGFKQVNLNKEVLRLNKYNLEKTVDDLCGVSEWDPMLDDLQEMGFTDTEVNKMLLKKNNGSIKRVVMDLIAGEKKYD